MSPDVQAEAGDAFDSGDTKANAAEGSADAGDAMSPAAPETEAGDEASDANNAERAVAVPPALASLSPADAALGEAVVLLGTDFLPDPRVTMNNVTVIPSEVTSTRMKMIVPADLPLASCSESVDVRVVNGAGTTAPLALRVHRPVPRITTLGITSVPAGGVLLLTGASLGGTSGVLDGVPLSVAATTDASVNLRIPRNTALGHHMLAVKGLCGEAALDVLVLAPAPRIVSADLGTVAPDGVLLVTVDVSNGAGFDSVRAGSASIGLTDPNVFRWLDQSDPAKSVFAVRMPADLGTGSANLSLQALATQSDPYAIAVIAPSTRGPAASAGIVFAPTKAADEPFPISSAYSFPQQDMQATNPDQSHGSWVYRLTFRDDAEKMLTSANRICTWHGTFTGSEYHCPAPDSGHSFDCPRFGTAGDSYNSLNGTYSLNSSVNHVDMFIDRLAPEGPEHYVGGWSQADGSMPVSTGVVEFLVLRSLRTGVILTIQHLFGSQGCHLPAVTDASAD